MKPKLLFRSRLALLPLLCLFLSFGATAQAPANDNCAGAVLLGAYPTPSYNCSPVTGTFIGATKSTSPVIAAPVSTFTSSGTFIVLGGVAGLKVECWGAGGGGGYGNVRGGGAGGGGYSTGIVSGVTDGGIYTVNVGAGGAGGTGVGIGGSGGISKLTDPTGTILLTAQGGSGGNSTGAIGAGAIIGTSSGTVSNLFYTGGAGGLGSGANSGGGGGGAGSTGNGNVGSAPTAGAATTLYGGAGGAGLSTGSGAGGNGANYGGGGGGGRSGNGGNGANGLVKVTYGDVNALDVWYKFQASSTTPSIELSNIGTDLLDNSLYLQLYSGACGSLTLMSTSTNGTLATSGLTIGTVYYVRVATITSLATPSTGNYTFNICILDDPLAAAVVDYSKDYVNITKGTVGGTANPGDTLEIRSTFVVQSGTITNISFRDTLKAAAGLTFIPGSLSTRTNEGKIYKSFTDALDLDAGTRGLSGIDTTILINIGAGATAITGGTLSNTSKPSFYGFRCIILATYRVKVTAGYNTKINFGGGAIRYTTASAQTISFPKDSLIVYPDLNACSDGVAPTSLIGSASNGTFGSPTIGSPASGTQNTVVSGLNTTYYYNTFSPGGPQDYYYGVANNTSATNTTDNTVSKSAAISRVFNIWDITGDHTNATNPSRGNSPCDPSLPVSATNPCGYMLVVNSSYKTDKVFEYNASGVCTDTYYEVSAWFKNLCYRCGCDSNGVGSGSAGYIPTATEDSSGVHPNIAMQIDGVDYYTTGDLVYQGLRNGNPARTQSGSDTLNNWVRRSFVFKTSPTQSSFKVTFRNNASGGGGNDWVVDDIGLRTCYPTMIYSPTNPIIFMGSALPITDTVRSYYNSYTYYKWQRLPAGSSTWADVVPAASGNATPTFNAMYGEWEYVISYTVPGTATMAGNSGDAYRMVVASNVINLASGCSYIPSTTFTLLPTDAPCALTNVNYAVAPQTGNIDWNKLSWSLGHVPTCCESAHITYNSTKGTADSVTVDITNDICIINLTLENNSTTANQGFKTILHPGYSMQMNGNVRMGASSAQSTDSTVFIAQGGGTITVNGNTVIGYPNDSAYCVFGSAPGIASVHNYVLKGDSLTFNKRSFTNDKLVTVTMSPADTAYLVNNTNSTPFPNAVTFENLKIGNGVNPATVIAAGSNANAYMNNRGGALQVSTNATLILPANYTVNARAAYNSSLLLKSNSTLAIGGYSGGTSGSNFPAYFTTYTADPLSTVQYYGSSSGTQTVYGTTYGRLELRNGNNALGAGRAQKITTAAFTSATSVNINRQTDFTLGTLGSSTQPVTANGTFTVNDSSGLYCNANVISGTGTFTLGNYSILGIGHALGITALGTAAGNIQVTGGRSFNIRGNYTYNGLVNQTTGTGLPSTCNDLTIDNPTTDTIKANQTVTGINALKQGVFNIGTTHLTITGNGTLSSISGKMKANLGILEMNGSSATAQAVDGNWFVGRNVSTLINSNTKGVTIAATANDTLLISSALLYGTSTVNSAIATNNNLTLLSRDTATARFGMMVGGNSITGNVNVERYVSTTRKWRLLAWNTASTQTARQSWMENNTVANGNLTPGYGTIVTDDKLTWAANNFDSKSVSGPSVKYYNPATNDYTGIPNTTAYQMNTTSAYYNFVRGDRSCTPANSLLSSTVLRSTGTLKTGNQVFTITASKFGAVGNPYASAIDIRQIDTLNLTSTFYVWDPKLSGIYGLGAYQTIYASGTNYKVLPGGGSYGPLNSFVDTIESGQGFFVRARATAGTLTVKEISKTIGARTLSRIESPPLPAVYSLLSLADLGSNTLVDGAMAAFDSTFNSSVDYDDALKMVNTSENVSYKRDGTLLSIERRKNITQDDTLFINVTGYRVHQYQWDITMDYMDDPDRTAFLIDNYLGTSTALNLTGTNSIMYSVENIAGSYAANRFYIVFKQNGVLPVRFTSISAARNNDKTVTVKWRTDNEINMQSYTVQRSLDGSRFTDIGTQQPLASGGGAATYSLDDQQASAGTNYYRVRGNSLNGQQQYTAIVKVGPIGDKLAVIDIYPNPVAGGNINLRFLNEPKGNYAVAVTDKIGRLMARETVNPDSDNFIYTLSLGSKAAAGGYQLSVSDSAGKITTIPFVIQ